MNFFEQIDEPNAYGYRYCSGNRAVEVLRSYPGDWFLYATIQGRVCKTHYDEKRPVSFRQARREAWDFLNGKITFEVWT